MTREEIIAGLKEKGAYFLRDREFATCCDLDGTFARKYLESKGFTVVENGDKGTHGYALTEEGIYLSTNGYISIPVELEKIYNKVPDESLKIATKRREPSDYLIVPILPMPTLPHYI